MNQSNIVSLDGHNAMSNDEGTSHAPLNAQVVRDIKHVTDDKLNKLVKEMFSNVDDFLFELAEKAETNDKQAVYFDAMRIVRLRRETIEKNYKNYIDATFNNGMMVPMSTLSPTSISTPSPHPPLGSLSELDLLGNDELEQNLAMTNMIEKAHNHAQRELYALAQRFNFLLSTDRFTVDEQPLCLARLCYAFRDAISVFEDETTIEIRLIIFKLFDRFVLSKISGLYSEINQVFIAANILPVIQNKVVRSTSPEQKNKENETTFLDHADLGEADSEFSCVDEPRNITHTTNDIQQQNNETFEQLQSLLSDWKSGTGINTSNDKISSPQEHSSPLPSVISALSALQSQHTTSLENQTPSVLNATAIQGAIKQQLIGINPDNTGSPMLDQDSTDTINIIEMLFEFILDDPTLDVEMKAVLARLQIPMLKASIMDKQFFSKNTHPARRLLNELAKAGMGWSKNESTHDDSVYLQIQATVHRVLTEFENDLSLFDQLLTEFSEFISHNEAQEQHAQLQLETIKSDVKVIIEERISNHLPPSLINHFLRFRWSEVLCTTNSTADKDSDGWQDAIEIMDELLWSIQPKSDPSERKLLTVLIPQLIENITSKLNSIETDKEELDTFLEALTLLHVASLKPSSNLQQKNNLEHAIEQLEADQEKEEINLQEDRELTDAMQMVSEITIGTWVEFSKADNHKVRGKLVWKDDYFDSYTFVNRRFKVISDRCQRDMAKLFIENKAHVINKVPLLDRALDAIIGKLSQKN